MSPFLEFLNDLAQLIAIAGIVAAICLLAIGLVAPPVAV